MRLVSFQIKDNVCRPLPVELTGNPPLARQLFVSTRGPELRIVRIAAGIATVPDVDLELSALLACTDLVLKPAECRPCPKIGFNFEQVLDAGTRVASQSGRWCCDHSDSSAGYATTGYHDV